MRTFTYLNLYGYLTDAVVVNRVFPEEVEGGYFARLARRASRSRWSSWARPSRPCPILTAPVLRAGGGGPADARPARRARCSATATPGDVLHEDLSQELDLGQRHGDAAAADPVRREGGHRAEEDRPRGGRAGGRSEADYHPAALTGGLPAALGAIRGRRAERSIRAERTMDPRQTTPEGLRRHTADSGGDELERRDSMAGWSPPPPPAAPAGCPTSRRVFALLDALRRMVPPELQEQFNALQREVLLTLQGADRLVPGAARRAIAAGRGRGHPDRLADEDGRGGRASASARLGELTRPGWRAARRSCSGRRGRGAVRARAAARSTRAPRRRGGNGRAGLVLEALARRARGRAASACPCLVHAALLGERDGGLEELLHLERGRSIVTRTCAGSSPAFAKLWTLPAGTTTVSPGPA